ncbi:MAG: alkaline phosphatase family protein, partial [Planctomycetaceae bacterium]
EYVITPVERVGHPNRILRHAGWIKIHEADGREHLVPAECDAWALVDHQFAHVFVKEPANVERVADLFRADATIARVLTGDERSDVGLNHPRSGEIVLIAQPDAWFAYYWWLEDDKAPAFARTVDIHRKPGYDPVEMFLDLPTRSTPLDATLVRGSHGHPADSPVRQGVLVSSESAALPAAEILKDTDVAAVVLRNFGLA